MDSDIKKVFQKAMYTPESRLSGSVWSAIQSKNIQGTKWKRFGYLSLSVISLSASALSIKTLIEQSTRMGFYKYLSLAFSDSGSIAIYWKEYVLSLADSLPVASLVTSLFLLLVLAIAIKKTSSQFKSKLSII